MPGHRAEQAGPRVEEPWGAPGRGGRPVAGVGPGEEQLPAAGQERRRVGRKAVRRAGRPGAGPRVEHLAVHRDLALAVQPGHGHHHAVAQFGQRRVPAGVVHRVDLDEARGFDVEDVRVPGALEILFLHRHRGADAVQQVVGLRAEQAPDPELVRLRGLLAASFPHRVHPDVLLAGHDPRPPVRRTGAGRRARDAHREGGRELHTARADEDRSLGQVPGLSGVVVDHRHAAAGVRRVQVLVPRGPARDEDVPVGQFDVPGAEQVPRRVDQPHSHGPRVEQQGLERAGVKERLVVAGARHDQYVPVVQQGGVDAVHLEPCRDMQFGPQPVPGFVTGPGDLVVVIPAGRLGA